MANELCTGCEVLLHVNKLLPFSDAMCKRLMFYVAQDTPVDQIRAAMGYRDEEQPVSLADAVFLLQPYKGKCRFHSSD